tara:strand:- start:1298 stop:1936 length:639 start_codon:yes stop_codon:yes gene_type:complete
MSKDKITDYSSTASSNTDIGSVNLAENSMLPSDVNNALREQMSHLAEMNAGTHPLADTVTLADPDDLTKKFRFDGVGITASNTRVLTVQDSDLTVAGTDVAQEFSKTQNFNATTLTDASTIAWDASANQVTSVTLAGNRTMNAPTNLVDGAVYLLIVLQDSTGSRTLSWNSVFKWAGGTAPTLTTTASARDQFVFCSNGTNLYEVGRALNVS